MEDKDMFNLHIINTRAADDLAMLGASALTAMVLTKLSHDIPFPPKRLKGHLVHNTAIICILKGEKRRPW